MALPARMRQDRPCAAARAKAMRAVPFQQPARRCRQFGVQRRQPCHRAAQFDKAVIVGQGRMVLFGWVEKRPLRGRVQPRGFPARQVRREPGRAIGDPQEQPVGCGGGQHRMPGRHKAQPVAGQQRLAAPQRQHAGARVGLQGRHACRIDPKRSGTVQPAAAAKGHPFRIPHGPAPLLSSSGVLDATAAAQGKAVAASVAEMQPKIARCAKWFASCWRHRPGALDFCKPCPEKQRACPGPPPILP